MQDKASATVGEELVQNENYLKCNIVSFPNGRICIFSLLSRIVNEYVFFLVPLIGLNKQFEDITLVSKNW